MVRSKLCAHTCTTHRRPVPDRGPSRQDGRVKPRRELRYRRSLIYKVPIFRMLGPSARYSRTYVPVETSTPPRRRSKLHIPRSAANGRARSFHCSSSSCRTRWRWAPPGGTGRLWKAVPAERVASLLLRSRRTRWRWAPPGGIGRLWKAAPWNGLPLEPIRSRRTGEGSAAAWGRDHVVPAALGSPRPARRAGGTWYLVRYCYDKKMRWAPHNYNMCGRRSGRAQHFSGAG